MRMRWSWTDVKYILCLPTFFFFLFWYAPATTSGYLYISAWNLTVFLISTNFICPCMTIDRKYWLVMGYLGLLYTWCHMVFFQLKNRIWQNHCHDLSILSCDERPKRKMYLHVEDLLLRNHPLSLQIFYYYRYRPIKKTCHDGGAQGSVEVANLGTLDGYPSAHPKGSSKVRPLVSLSGHRIWIIFHADIFRTMGITTKWRNLEIYPLPLFRNF